jgi:hypothetical protein
MAFQMLLAHTVARFVSGTPAQTPRAGGIASS